MESAVIDRIVDGRIAVLLVGEKQEQFLFPLEDLPKGAKEGSWLLVRIEEKKLLAAKLDEAKLAEAKKRIEAKLDRLRRRGRD